MNYNGNATLASLGSGACSASEGGYGVTPAGLVASEAG